MELVTDKLKFPEGPIAMADGSVILVEINTQRLTRVLPDGNLQVIAELGGGPNGAAIGPDGAVYVVNNGGFGWVELPDGKLATHGTASDYRTGSVQRVDLHSGKVDVLYESCEGRQLRGPNDIVFDAQGGFYFTDMGKSDGERMDIGAIYYGLPDGSKIKQVARGQITPNGIGLSPDGKTLYVAESVTSRLLMMTIVAPGEVDPVSASLMTGKVMGPLPGTQFFDSLAVEEGGGVCVATIGAFDGISVMRPDQSPEQIAVPGPFVTNICFGGADMRDAWITSSSNGRLYKTRWPRPGLKLAFNG
ncbi:SMP-30/gluconolactonase/LRE family protein [Novosphingobium pentaromativorans]|uniref:Antibiotic induced protein, Drp35 n=1 Tax=Novosphingobium pentaromativorans US6-1 TaxID=1088721 RepID=G6E871_9SPHN|nr:antibiotic induced protein, Drp35 [Novosphingobium pentaromativorans US6-1]